MTIKQLSPMVNKVTGHSIREISGVEIEEIKDSNGNVTCEVKLLMLGGDRICLSAGSHRAEQQKIAELARSYLNARSR
jgi:hypothetical protein